MKTFSFRFRVAVGLALVCVSLVVVVQRQRWAGGPTEVERGEEKASMAGGAESDEEAVDPVRANGGETLAGATAPRAGASGREALESGWIEGRVGRFFETARVVEAKRHAAGPLVEDRRTLLEVMEGERTGERVLVEERFLGEVGSERALYWSRASMADSMVAGMGAGSAGRLASQLQAAGFELSQKSGYSPAVVRFAERGGIDETLAARERAQSVEGLRFVEPNYIYTTQAEPDDPYYVDDRLWGLNNVETNAGGEDVDINAPEGWTARRAAEDVVVAVIDTGIFYEHEDLRDNLWVNPGEVAGNGIDDDGNGFVDDVHGINAITGTGDPLDDHGHGSHCAGTIGGQGDNATGVVGVAWDVQLMGCKFLSSGGWGTLADAVTAVNYAHEMGARLTSNSWGGGGYSQALYEAFAAGEELGVVSVAAAGNSLNDNDAMPSYPSSYELANIVSVAAVDRAGELAWFSNYGANSVDIAAPGVDIFSSVNSESGYEAFSGTSMACPHVSGALALCMVEFPEEDIYRLINRLVSGAKPLASLPGKVLAEGMLDLEASLTTPSFPFKPLFTRELKGGGYVVGEALELAVEAIGDEPIQYQWYFEGEAIAGATGASLRIAEAGEAEQGVYALVASNPAGERETRARWVAFAPTPEPLAATVTKDSIQWAEAVLPKEQRWAFVEEILPPGSGLGGSMQSGRVGDDETTGLMALARGPGTLSFRWKADCDPSGQDRLALYVDGQLERSLKPYRYAATEWFGQSVWVPEGEHQILFAYEKDAFLLGGNDTGWIGEVSLSGSASGGGEGGDGLVVSRERRRLVEGTPALFNYVNWVNTSYEIDWLKDGVSLERDAVWLHLPSVSVADAGRYEFHFKEEVWNGSAYTTQDRIAVYELEVATAEEAETPPMIVEEPSDVETGASRVSLRVSAESLLPPRYQWRFEGEALAGETRSVLTLRSFGPAKAGVYDVVVENDAGSVVSRGARVSYQETAGNRLMIVGQPQAYVAEQGQDIVLPIEAVGTGPLRYRWFRENTLLEGQTGAALRLSQASAVLHSGSYSVEVSDGSGMVRSWPIELSVNSPNGLAEAVDRPGEKWYSVGNTPWTIDRRVSTDGEDSAFLLGTNMKIYETSRLETQVFGPATVRFNWNTQGGQYFDVALLEDGENTGLSKFGSTGWDAAEHVIDEAGLHTLAWEMTSFTSTSTGYAPNTHMLAWVDQVEIERPERANFLPNEIRYASGRELETPLSVAGYVDVEVDGLPSWLELDKSSLSLRGAPEGQGSHWLRFRLRRATGEEDVAWTLLAEERAPESVGWQVLNGSASGGGQVVGHFRRDGRAAVVFGDGRVYRSADGRDWEVSYIPLQEGGERLWWAGQLGEEAVALSYSGVYESSDGLLWARVGDHQSRAPDRGNLIETDYGHYGLSWNGLAFTQDFRAWNVILPNPAGVRMGRLFRWDGDLYGVNEWGAGGIYRYRAAQNDWEKALSSAPGTVPTQADGWLYWMRASTGSGTSEFVRAREIGGEAQVLARYDRFYAGAAVNGDRFLLWGAQGYLEGTLEGGELLEVGGDRYALERSDATRWVATGETFVVYAGRQLVVHEGELPEGVDVPDGLEQVDQVASTGETTLLLDRSNRQALISDDGERFERVETGYSFLTVVGDEGELVGQVGREFYRSSDGRSWSREGSLPDPQGGEELGYSSVNYENGAFSMRMNSADWSYEYVSPNGKDWTLIEHPADATLSVDGYADFGGRVLSLRMREGGGRGLFELDEGSWQLLRPVEDYYRMLVGGDGERLYLVGHYGFARSDDLATWETVEKRIENPYLTSRDGRWFNLSSGQLTLYNERFAKTFDLSTPIGLSGYLAFAGDSVYLANYQGLAIRLPLPTASNRVAGPSYGHPGPVRSGAFLYVADYSLPENSFGGVNLGKLGVEGAGLVAPVTFRLVEDAEHPANDWFEITEGELMAKRVFDYEETPSAALRIEATGAEGSRYEDTLLIEVEDLNEGPTDIGLSANAFSERVPVGTPLASFYAIDQDALDSFGYVFEDGEGAADNGSFSIVNNQLVSREAFDVRVKSVFRIRVKATDSAGHSVSRSFTLRALEESEAALGGFGHWIRDRMEDDSVGDELMGADGDGDGLSNLMEYYLDTDPLLAEADAPLSLEMARGERLVDVVLFGRVNDSSLLWELEVSSDGKSWGVVPLRFANGAWSVDSEAGWVVDAVNERPGLWRVRARLALPEEAALYRLGIRYDSP